MNRGLLGSRGIMAVCSKGGSNIFVLNLQPLLWTGMRAAHAKMTINGSGISKHVHFYVIFFIYLSYKCGSLYVLPSFRMEQLGSHWADFHEN